MRRMILPLACVASVLVACGGTETTNTAQTDTAPTDTVAITTTPSATEPSTTTAAPTTTDVPATDTPPTDAPADGIVNVWVGPAADLTALPIGTDSVSLTEASVGGLLACDAGNPNGGGAFAVGPWVDEDAGTWDATQKVSVNGAVEWPMAEYSESIEGDTRVIASNGLPVGSVTGVFPIAADDPAFSYDRNPNSIAESDIAVALTTEPTATGTPACLGKGAIGIMRNGVVLYAPLDELNRDAVVYETQDDCDGHPQQSSTYHYHDVPSCIRDAATAASTVVGFAFDGFPIVVERDADGDLPTNADLDECHGRTSAIELDGEIVEMYHYSVTAEFPYALGCYAGTVSTNG